MSKPKYIVERWENGWVFCGTDEQPGIPMGALSECVSLMPKNSNVRADIVHHLRQTGRLNTVLCVATPHEAKKWVSEIEQTLKHLSPQERWWKGLDVGKSSAALFAVFCSNAWSYIASEYGQASTPQDADDFGRCDRLLKLFPEWRARLDEVPKKYYSTLWPPIIKRWPELEAATPIEQTKILQSIIGPRK